MFVCLFVFTGIHNAWVFEKEVSESFSQDMLDYHGADILCLHQVFSKYISNNNGIHCSRVSKEWPFTDLLESKLLANCLSTFSRSVVGSLILWAPTTDQRQTSSFKFIASSVCYTMEKLSRDLLFGLKFVKLSILPTLFAHFV